MKLVIAASTTGILALIGLSGSPAGASTPPAAHATAHPARPTHPTRSYTGHELAGQAHITIEAARAIALRAHPGRLTDQELERERGGSGLRYSFDIVDHGRTIEVGVDAQTGRVLENAAEGPNPD